MNPLIGVVVPGLEEGGGVPSVAEFVCSAIEQSCAFRVKLVSLATSARDTIGVALTRPTTWTRGVRTNTSVWRGRPVTRVGAFASELEFQRFRPRRALSALMADCDVIQVISGSPAWAWSVCGLGKPLAVQCATRAVVERRRRSATERGPKAAWRRWMTPITDRMDRKALLAADAIQVENPWMLDYVTRVTAGRDVLVRYAPPGVDARRFCPAPSRNLHSSPYVLCVGRLDDPRKNVELLLTAFAMLPSNVDKMVHLVVSGLTQPSVRWWDRVNDLGLAERVGSVPSPDTEALIRLYQGASVLALTSDEEGLGMVILEAMSCGIPVVATRSGGPEGIITDGKDGYLVAVNDARGMADRLARLLTDESLNRSMGVLARRTIVDRYEANDAGEAFLKIYDQMLSRHRVTAAHVG